MLQNKLKILANELLFGQRSFPDITVVGAPVVTHSSSATTVAAALPVVAGGIQAGDYIIAFCSHKFQGSAVEGPAGFKAHKQTNVNNGSNGTDVGSTTATTFSKKAVGGESGNLTFNLPDPVDTPASTNSNVISVTLWVIRPGSTKAKIDINVISGSHRSFNETVNIATAVACKAHNLYSPKKGDEIFCCGSSNADTYGFINRALGNLGGVTATTVTQNFFQGGTSFGNDQYVFGSRFRITGGAGSIRPEYTATSVLASDGVTVSSGLRAPWVTVHMIIIRQISNEPSYVPSRYDWIDPYAVDNSNIDAQNGIWNVMKIDTEGTGVTFGIEEKYGSLHFWIKNNLADYLTTANRRGEVHFTPFQPKWVPLTKMFLGYRFRNDRIPVLPDQWILWQCHTGSAGSTPNHPIAYLEFVKAGQLSNIQGNPGPVPAGTLVAAIGMSTAGGGSTISTRKYIAVPYINAYNIGGIDLPLEIMIKFGTAGNGRFILASNGTVLINETAYATMATDPTELGEGVGTGSVAGVGGVGKMNLYAHQFDTFGDPSDAKSYRDAYVNAGLTPEIKNYHKGFKRSVKLPTDWDYDDSLDFATLLKMIV